jgi:LysM domain
MAQSLSGSAIQSPFKSGWSQQRNWVEGKSRTVGAIHGRSGMTERSSRVHKGRSLITLVIALVCGIGILSLIHHNNGVVDAGTRAQFYTVHSGDTLWTIAQKTAKAGVDTRSVVAQMMQVNHMKSAAIYPGETLALPSQ